METTKIALFRGKKIRKTIYKNEWWFSVVDVIEALTDSARASAYWTAMKVRVKNEDGIQLSTICRQLKLPAPDGKMRETDCVFLKPRLASLQVNNVISKENYLKKPESQKYQRSVVANSLRLKGKKL
ncbi:MAG: hypothetical protein AAB863_01880 [Patescibacteria group bacterium]